jgi:hypothetical protein
MQKQDDFNKINLYKEEGEKLVGPNNMRNGFDLKEKEHVMGLISEYE